MLYELVQHRPANKADGDLCERNGRVSVCLAAEVGIETKGCSSVCQSEQGSASVVALDVYGDGAGEHKVDAITRLALSENVSAG